MMTRSIAFRLAVGLCALSLSVVARADDLPSNATERVAAVVNDDAITIHDLDARVRLGLLAANLPDTAEQRRQVAAEILRRLIDEHLEVQEAARNKITITDGEVASGVADLEKQNHMEKGQLIALLENNGIDPQTLRDQVRAQQLWVRVVRQVLLPTVRVGEEEIDARLAQMKDGLNKPAYLAADIYLAVEDPRREGEVRQLADSLVQQLRGGAQFSALARQFSQSGAAAGGDLGWVSPGMIDNQLFDALTKLELHRVSDPVRTRDGFHILLLRDKHTAGEQLSSEPTFDLAQLDVTQLPSSSPEERKQQVERIHAAVDKDRNCDDYERHLRGIGTAHFARAGLVRPSETPLEVRPLLENLVKGEMSEPLRLEDGLRFFIACDRTDPVNGLPSRDEVRHRIESERVELLATRYLRDLRRAAFVEIRI